jgi:hypothetical protein
MEIKEKLKNIVETFEIESSRCTAYRLENNWIYDVGTFKKISAKNDLTIGEYQTILQESIEKLEQILEIDLENKDLGTSSIKLQTFDKFIENCKAVNWIEKNNGTNIMNDEEFMKHIQIEIDIKKNWIKEIQKTIEYIEKKLMSNKKTYSIRGSAEQVDSLTLKLLFGEI